MKTKTRFHIHHLISKFVIWRLRRAGVKLGEGCLISRRSNFDRIYPERIEIGDYTSISFDVSILTHDFIKGKSLPVKIGSNCFVGARSIIMPGVTIGDHVIVGVGSVVLTDVPSNCVVAGNPARVVETNIVTTRYGVRHPVALAKAGLAGSKDSAHPAKTADMDRPEVLDDDLLSKLFPSVSDHSLTFDELGIDSFALITLRAQIEEDYHLTISDEDWLEVRAPRDIARIVRPRRQTPTVSAKRSFIERFQEIGMPQMAMGGLSESWLFKEIGDLHWSLLTTALGVASSEIRDQRGDRLYATFTRIRYSSDLPLSEYRENDQLHFSGEMSRFGSGMFFSSISAESSAATARFEVMSTFSKFGEEGNNSSLVKGQPDIPADFPVKSHASLPQFAEEYRAVRLEEGHESLFSCDYTIVPQHDINGVGLLYFAAYPIIMEICLGRFLQNRGVWSPIERDCFYFANSASDDAIRFDVVAASFEGDDLFVTTTLTRSDGKRMALARTHAKQGKQLAPVFV